MRALGKKASYLLCDLDPESAEDLRRAGGNLSTRVVETDGVETIRHEAEGARVNPSDVLVHIDPYEPHERLTRNGMTPIELAGWLASAGFRVFYWYGYDSTAERGWARREISRLAPRVELWCGDVRLPSPFVYPGLSGAWGCGIVLANMAPAEKETCARLGRALERVSADDVLANNEPERLTFAVVGE